MKKYLLLYPAANYIGNSPQFWRKGGCGYTQWIDEAEQFTKEEAEKTIRSCSGHGFQAISVEYLDTIAKRTVDIQDMRKETVCQSCGSEIAYDSLNGFWKHTKTNPRHPAKPKQLSF